MKQNISSTVSNLRTTGLPMSYPSLYQLSYNSIIAFLKLQYINCQLNDFSHFYALQWLDGSTVVVAVQK
jgi:competence transcription factor ComK